MIGGGGGANGSRDRATVKFADGHIRELPNTAGPTAV
jgi:hypothetical protein